MTMPQTGSTGPAVRVEDLTFSYHHRRVLDGLTLEVPAGVSYGLLGPNGAGKTTFIRLLIGLLRPAAGRVLILGHPPSRERSHLIGYMPQLPSLYTELSVQQNVAFFASIYRVRGRKEREYCVQKVLELVDMWSRRSSPVHQLSGGMKQRVSLACAIVHDPPLLFLDEPTVGLDPELRVVFWSYFQDLTRKGNTLVISSHTMDDAAHCDLLGFIREGRLIASGTPEHLKKATGQAGASLEDAFLHFVRQGKKETGD